MATQMIIRVEPGLKDKIRQLAKSEGKNLSELVRELLRNSQVKGTWVAISTTFGIG